MSGRWPCEDVPTELSAALSELEDLRAALRTMPVIEQAKGILMAQHHCDPETAFVMLRSASMRDNRKLNELAACIVTDIVLPARPPAARQGDDHPADVSPAGSSTGA